MLLLQKQFFASLILVQYFYNLSIQFLSQSRKKAIHKQIFKTCIHSLKLKFLIFSQILNFLDYFENGYLKPLGQNLLMKKGQVFNDFKLTSKIGKGSFGIVYSAIYLKNQQKYAIKIQSNKTVSSQLIFEYEVYKYLNICFKSLKIQNLPIPEIYVQFSTKQYTFLVMKLLGKSLYDMFKQNKRSIDPRKAIGYAKNMVSIMKTIHTAELIYRDIKPENFIFKTQNEEQLVLVDFGLCKKLIPFNQRSKCKLSSNVIGTSRYASINAHEGKNITKKDDIQSLIYVIIYLLKGNLPWQGIKQKNQQLKDNLVLKMKKSISIDELCEGLPDEFKKLVQYIKTQDLSNQIRYEYIQECLDDCIIQIDEKEEKQKFNKGWTFNEVINSIQNLQIEKEKEKNHIESNIDQSIFHINQQKTQQNKQDQISMSKIKQKSRKRPQIQKKFVLNQDSQDSQFSENQQNCKFLDS